MRTMMRGAMDDAKGVLMDLAQGDLGLSDDQVVTRYVREHRGNPRAMLEFTRQQMPQGSDVWSEAEKYEAEMEAILKRNRGGI